MHPGGTAAQEPGADAEHESDHRSHGDEIRTKQPENRGEDVVGQGRALIDGVDVERPSIKQQPCDGSVDGFVHVPHQVSETRIP